ncbi:MAG: nucleoside deaminase [Verrucomicrobia bacterium]|nr:nucleoside deaminase [Verrucomicrobiota bacterium]
MPPSNFMREAIRLSLAGMRRGSGGPFGAVIVRRGEIIARGWNRVTSANDPTAHAEVVAIRRACRKLGVFHLRDCVLYASCEPCPMCLAAICWARIPKVYFANTHADAAAIGFDDEFFYRELARPAGRRRLKMKPLLRAEALVAFEEWRTKGDKTPY